MSYNERDKILIKVQKPTRYTGGELNSVVKDKNAGDFVFRMFMKLLCPISV